MPKKAYQGFINQIKDLIDSEIGVIDDAGIIIACSDESRIGVISPDSNYILEEKEQFFTIGRFLYQKIFLRNRIEFIVYVESSNSDCRKIISLISINLANLKLFHDEKYDKNSFIRDILYGNITHGEVLSRAKDLHISADVNRIAILIKCEKAREVFLYDIIQEMFPNKSKDFVILLDDENVVLIKELKLHEGYKEIDKTSRSIVDTMLAESMVKTSVATGTIVGNILDLKRSLDEAQISLKICEVFESEKSVVSYSNLGLGRLIYELPDWLCRLFLEEVFKDSPLEHLDSEILLTIQKFFENNLNVSETSRQLYVHRNTLVYRLDKIQKLTGLDLRRFDDAIIFKFAMLVKRYVDSRRKQPE